MRILSEFISDDGERTASVLFVDENTFCVEMYKHKDVVERRIIEGHTLQYAEDCADNWVRGIIK